MTNRDKMEFRLYLRDCTDAQVQGVYEKEKRANRDDYAELAKDEGYLRNIHIG